MSKTVKLLMLVAVVAFVALPSLLSAFEIKLQLVPPADYTLKDNDLWPNQDAAYEKFKPITKEITVQDGAVTRTGKITIYWEYWVNKNPPAEIQPDPVYPQPYAEKDYRGNLDGPSFGKAIAEGTIKGMVLRGYKFPTWLEDAHLTVDNIAWKWRTTRYKEIVTPAKDLRKKYDAYPPIEPGEVKYKPWVRGPFVRDLPKQ